MRVEKESQGITETVFRENHSWLCADISELEYGRSREIQVALVDARRAGAVGDIVLLVEHPPVFTLGRRGGTENLCVSRDFLTEAGIPLVQVERGGNITFHGPGQLVGYPILDLREMGMGVVDYVSALEEVMIRTAGDFGIDAGRSPLNRGIWVGDRKMGSVGIAVRRSVCFHGIAFNVNVSLEPFRWINPCGLAGVEVTSMKRELGETVPMENVRERIKRHMRDVFGVGFSMLGLDEVEKLLELRG